VQHRYGERKNRSRARMKYVVQKMGLEKFRATVEAEVARVTAERGDELREQVREMTAEYRVPPPSQAPTTTSRPEPGYERWRRSSTRPQQQPGHRAVLVELPLGDITADQMRAIAKLARTLGNGTVRATNDQNLVLPWVSEAALPALHAALVAQDLASSDAGTINDVVSCPGMDYCSLAITRSMGVAEDIRAHLLGNGRSGDGLADRIGPFTVKISGCPNSCGQHHIGNIGLTGHSVKGDDGAERPFYSILVGGSVGEGRARIGKRLGRFAENDAPAVIAGLARFYERERRSGEDFPSFVERVGLAALGDVARAAGGTAAE